MLRQEHSPRADIVERKQATVLFADIVDSTAMIAGLDAEEAMERLRPVMAAMSRAARRFEGAILRSLGDGLKVVFGAPRALEGHAILACRTALAMQEAVRALDRAPAIRIGLHSGEVVAGDIDTGPAVEQAAQGMTVHIARRLEQLAEPGSICISDASFQLVRAFCDAVPLDKRTLRGVPEPVQIYRLAGLRPAVSSEQFRDADLTPFRGRDGELATLDQALAEALQGAPNVVGISAGPGVGKSRLCFEFSEQCRRRSIPVTEARCFVHGQSTPTLPIVEMLRAFFRVSPLDEAGAVRRKVEQAVASLDPSLLAEVGLLFRLLSVADPSGPAPTDPVLAQVRLRAVLAGLVKAAGREPGVLIFEDLHWLDAASGNLLEAMIRASAGTRLLMLLNFRPGFHARWMDEPRYRALALEELDDGASDALVGDLLGPDEALAPLRAQVAEQCAGNPFFAEELVRSLAETNVLIGLPGQYRPGPAAAGVVLPATVEAVIGARIDRLAEPAKALLQVGATIGKEFPFVLLREVVPTPPDELDRRLAQLCEAGLLQQRGSMFGRGFGFGHPLIHDVAYAMQLRARRRDMHAQVVKAIEQFPWSQLDEVAGDLARHCEASGDVLAAAAHLRRSALWLSQTDVAGALQQWKKVCTLLESVPRSADTDRLHAEACGAVLGLGWKTGMGAGEAKPYADEALRYAREVGDAIQGPLLRIAYGRIVIAGGSADDYVEVAREALSYQPNADHETLNALLHGAYAQGLMYAGRLREALRTIASGIELLRTARPSAASIENTAYIRQRVGFDVGNWLLGLRAMVLVWLGRFAEAEIILGDLDRFKNDAAVVQIVPHLAATTMAYWRQDPPAGKHHAAFLDECAKRVRLPYLRVVALTGAGMANTAAQEFDPALTALQEALAYSRRLRAGLEYEPMLMGLMADATLRSGAVEAAVELAGDAIAVARERSHRVFECHAALVSATALLTHGVRGSVSQAETLLARVEELIDITGAGVFEPMLTRTRWFLAAS